MFTTATLVFVQQADRIASLVSVLRIYSRTSCQRGTELRGFLDFLIDSFSEVNLFIEHIFRAWYWNIFARLSIQFS